MQKTQRNNKERFEKYYQKERLAAISNLVATFNQDEKLNIIQQFEQSNIFKSMNRLIFLRVLYRKEGIKDRAIRSHFYQFITEKFLPAHYINFNDWYQFKMKEKTDN